MDSGFTKTPNFVFEIMPQLTPAEFKVIMVIVRQTYGYHKLSDAISLTQFESMTELSRQGVVNALSSLIEKNFVTKSTMGNTHKYAVKLVNSVDYHAEAQAVESPQLVNSVDQNQSTQLTTKAATSQLSRPELVNSVDTQKKKEIDQDDHLPGRLLRSMVEGAGFAYMDRNFNEIACKLEADYSHEQLIRALQSTKEAHQKKISGGERGIIAPLAYMKTVLVGDNQSNGNGSSNGNGAKAVKSKPVGTVLSKAENLR